jgi:hypothetical protein
MAQHTDGSAPDPAVERVGEALPLNELEVILSRPPSRRKRLTQLGLVLLAAMAALVLLWGSTAQGGPSAPASAPTPSTSPPLLLILGDVNYGTLSINGNRQPGQLPLLVAVHSKSLDIRLNAPPFGSLSCQLNLAALNGSGSPATDRHCLALPVSNAGLFSLNGVTGRPAFEAYLSLGLADLPPDQQNQVTALVSQALSLRQDTAVPVGSYFATSFTAPTAIASQRASTPLKASVTVAPAEYGGSAPFCAEFICPRVIDPAIASSLTGGQWVVKVTLAVSWRFSTASGAVVSRVPFLVTSRGGSAAATAALFLSPAKNGAWTISHNAPVPNFAGQLQDAFCSSGETILQQAVGYDPSSGIVTNSDQGAPGCEIHLYLQNTFRGTFLWRFGVLLAVDARAHATDPHVPVAPPEEVAAAGG